jgi:hypothetical protein
MKHESPAIVADDVARQAELEVPMPQPVDDLRDNAADRAVHRPLGGDVKL